MLIGSLTLATAACRSDETVVYVATASSLAGPFTELEARFERMHPGVDVVLDLSGSSTLRYQILEGAPIDVFASASIDVMEDVTSAGLTLDSPVNFASNTMVIVVPVGNPAGVTGLVDFGNADLVVAACDSSVPCGALADAIFERAGVVPDLDSREPSAVSLVGKVERGELDAGIAYVTDISMDVDSISITGVANLTTTYPIAALSSGAHPDLAREFVELVISADGRALLEEWGFEEP